MGNLACVEANSTLISKNVTINGHRTSIRLEPEMWQALKEISSRERCSIHEICSLVAARKKGNSSLTAAIRVFLMLYYRSATTEDGHSRAGHGSFNMMRKRALENGDDVKSKAKRQLLYSDQNITPVKKSSLNGQRDSSGLV